MTGNIDAATFSSDLARDGYIEVETKFIEPKPENNMHTHDFAVRGLVLQGAFTVGRPDAKKTFGPGEVFEVDAGCQHTETIGADGARVLVGRKYE